MGSLEPAREADWLRTVEHAEALRAHVALT